MERKKILKSELEDLVRKRFYNKKELSSYYGLSESQITKLLKTVGLRLSKTKVEFEIIDVEEEPIPLPVNTCSGAPDPETFKVPEDNTEELQQANFPLFLN